MRIARPTTSRTFAASKGQVRKSIAPSRVDSIATSLATEAVTRTTGTAGFDWRISSSAAETVAVGRLRVDDDDIGFRRAVASGGLARRGGRVNRHVGVIEATLKYADDVRVIVDDQQRRHGRLPFRCGEIRLRCNFLGTLAINCALGSIDAGSRRESP